jgi:hypothetical protein
MTPCSRETRYSGQPVVEVWRSITWSPAGQCTPERSLSSAVSSSSSSRQKVTSASSSSGATCSVSSP